MKKYTSLILLLIAFSSPSHQVDAAEWEYQIEPYLMATSIGGNAGVGRISGAEVDVDFDDILENLELAGMIHFEAFNGNGWGFILDYGFMDLGSDISGPVNGVVKANVRQGVFEADLAYRVEYGNGNLDYLVGLRWWDNDLDVSIDNAILPGTISTKKDIDWVDPIVGVRWSSRIDNQWEYYIKGDVGGFGIASDFTSSLMTGVKYSLNDDWKADIAYKATWVDYEEGTKGSSDYFAYDTVTKGMVIGFIYQF